MSTTNRSAKGGWRDGGSGAGLSLLKLQPSDDGWWAEIEVAGDAAWFAGHFPGAPILPAVAQVDLVARVAAESGAADGFLAVLDNLRLSAPVRPGDRLELHLVRPDAQGGARFHLRRAGGERVSDGAVAWMPNDPPPEAAAVPPAHPAQPAPPSAASSADAGTAPATPSPSETSPLADPSTFVPDPAAVLLHQPPALLAEAVLAVEGDEILCRGRVPAGNASVRDGHAGPWMALELAAQAAGLLEAAKRQRDADEAGAAPPAPRTGYLVRVRNARFAVPRVAAEAPLVARVRQEGRGGPLTQWQATVEDADGRPVAAAGLGTFVPPGG